jgi:hypothetical protein
MGRKLYNQRNQPTSAFTMISIEVAKYQDSSGNSGNSLYKQIYGLFELPEVQPLN